MKTSFTSILALVSTMLLFNACQKDSLVDSISPEYTANKSVELRAISDLITFEIWQNVEILQPDCDTDPIMSKNSENNDDEITRYSGCYGQFGLTSNEGQGWMMEYGRFLSTIELMFDPDKDQVRGTINLQFQNEGDMLILMAFGNFTKIELADGGYTLMVNVLSQKGTDRFANVNFSGMLTIMDADLIFDGDAIDYSATLVVKGAFGK
jgi:hypothetical protein